MYAGLREFVTRAVRGCDKSDPNFRGRLVWMLPKYIRVNENKAAVHRCWSCELVILQDPTSNMWDLLQEYKEEMFGCTNTIGSGGDGNRNLLTPCDKIPGDELRLRYRQDPHVSFVVKAVSALTAAFRLVQLEQG